MSEAAETDEAPVVEATAEVAKADPTADIQAAAREGGWRPKEEYDGDPEKWLDAPQFVLNAAKILPHVTRELREARSEIKEVKRDLKEFGKFHSQTAQREYDRALKDIEARLNQAHAENDIQGIHDAAEDLADLKAEAKTAPKDAGPEIPPELQGWMDENPWFGKDKALTAATQAIAQEVFDEGYSGKAQVKEVDRRVREAFPEKFAKAENPNRTNAAAVEGAGSPAAKRGKGRSDLPADARATMDRWVKQGLMTEAQYLKDYQW